MVFANLTQRDKEAFFSLLDEYFESRPHLLGNASGSINTSAITSSIQSNPLVQAAAANPKAATSVATFGLKRAAAANSNTPAHQGGQQASPASDVAGKVGAMAARFASSGIGPYGGARSANVNTSNEPSESEPAASVAASSKPQPPPPPRRTPSDNSTKSTANNGIAGLVTSQRFGNLGVGSKSDFVSSLRGGSAPAKSAIPPPEPALAPRKADFPAPPMRRVTPTPPKRAPTPEPEPEPEEEEEAEQGEWVVSLYGFTSPDATDLNFKEGQRILLKERTSEDWWTGELNGKSGLFPASYVEAA